MGYGSKYSEPLAPWEKELLYGNDADRYRNLRNAINKRISELNESIRVSRETIGNLIINGRTLDNVTVQAEVTKARAARALLDELKAL